MKLTSHLEPYFGTFGGRTAPTDTVAQLREVDPMAELLYLGKGHWALGVVRPTVVRRAAGEHQLDELDELFALAGQGKVAIDNPELLTYLQKELLSSRWLYRGFAPVAAYKVQGWPGALIVQDFRERDWLWRHELRKKWREMVHVASGDAALEARQNMARQNVYDDRHHIERHAFRKPHTVTPGAKERVPSGFVRHTTGAA